MNTKRVWLKWLSVTALVALAGSTMVGAVLAKPHITPSFPTHLDSGARFEQYLTAVERAEIARIAAYDTQLAALRLSSLDYFKQYTDAIELAEQNRTAVLSAERRRSADHSGVRFAQYMAAINRAEQDRVAAFGNP